MSSLFALSAKGDVTRKLNFKNSKTAFAINKRGFRISENICSYQRVTQTLTSSVYHKSLP
jgi:hypothetical protein